jgi:folate-binding protein YgfZ
MPSIFMESFMTSLEDIIDSTLQNKDVVVRLQNMGVLRITGLDARKFLQGQITCDINKLSAEHGLYGAICSVKGRIITNFYLVQKGEDILMLMSKDLVEKTLLHLKKYAVFFKAELINDSDSFVIHSKLTPSQSGSTENAQPELFNTRHDDDTITLTLCHNPLTIQWLITDADNDVIKEKNTDLNALTLLSARPLITLEQSENILPQWLNMQSIGGISFTKGCYTGQEIVARMQYRGKSKKQLILATWDGHRETSLDITDEQGKSIGQVFAVANIEETHLAQIILNVEPNEVDNILLDNQEVTLLPLPYPLDMKK